MRYFKLHTFLLLLIKKRSKSDISWLQDDIWKIVVLHEIYRENWNFVHFRDLSYNCKTENALLSVNSFQCLSLNGTICWFRESWELENVFRSFTFKLAMNRIFVSMTLIFILFYTLAVLSMCQVAIEYIDSFQGRRSKE